MLEGSYVIYVLLRIVFTPANLLAMVYNAIAPRTGAL